MTDDSESESVTVDFCDDCGETVYYWDAGIACDWYDLADEHECDGEWDD